MKKLIVAAAGVLALALVPSAAAGLLTLVPTSFGEHTTASWRAQEGLPDTVGLANQALVLEKEVLEPGPAAVAVVLGVEGVRVAGLTGLEWERRVPTSDCNLTSPRWELVVRGKSGREYVTRFGCAAALHVPGSAPNWVRDFNPRSLIRVRLLRAGGTDALAGTIVSLAIVFDQRSRTGVAILDNIKVQGSGIGANVWTSAADNGVAPLGAPSWAPRAEPFAEDDFRTFDELWPLLTAEEQALVLSDDDPAYG